MNIRKQGAFWVAVTLLLVGGATPVTAQQQMEATNPTDLIRLGDKVIKVNEAISMVEGFGNTFMVTTSEGNVIIDTSIALHARKHHELLTADNKTPIKYIILTHGHGDHTGGVPLWKEAGTQIIAIVDDLDLGEGHGDPALQRMTLARHLEPEARLLVAGRNYEKMIRVGIEVGKNRLMGNTCAGEMSRRLHSVSKGCDVLVVYRDDFLGRGLAELNGGKR